MVPRVEPGKFWLYVGGVSPDVPDSVVDDRKTKIGFSDSAEGLSEEFEETKVYQAQFVYSLDASNRVRRG
jgi:hypothetical protein